MTRPLGAEYDLTKRLHLVVSPVPEAERQSRHMMASTVTWRGRRVATVYQMQGESFVTIEDLDDGKSSCDNLDAALDEIRDAVFFRCLYCFEKLSRYDANEDGGVCRRCHDRSQFYQAPPDKITLTQNQEYELMEYICRRPDWAIDALRAGTRLNDGARNGLAGWCSTYLEFPGPEKDDYRDRHALLKACLDAGQISATDLDVFAPARGQGNTWLHVLCRYYWTVAGLELLLEYGAATVINARNGAGNTPLHCYLQRGIKSRWERPALTGVRLLLDHGADPTLINNAGQTPADIARAAPCNTPDSKQHQRALLAMVGVPA